MLRAKSSSAVAALRVNEIAIPRQPYLTVTLPSLQEQNIRLDTDLIAAIGDLARLLGLRPDSPIALIASVVNDYCRGWGVKVDEYRTQSEWLKAASVFAKSFCGATNNFVQFQEARDAFLEGVKWVGSRICSAAVQR